MASSIFSAISTAQMMELKRHSRRFISTKKQSAVQRLFCRRAADRLSFAFPYNSLIVAVIAMFLIRFAGE